MSEEVQQSDQPLESLHHVAIVVDDVAAALRWYQEKFSCQVVHADETWGMLKFANCYLALVGPNQHPPHLGFLTSANHAERFGTLKPHRDGTKSVYLTDPSGNSVELLVDERERAEY